MDSDINDSVNNNMDDFESNLSGILVMMIWMIKMVIISIRMRTRVIRLVIIILITTNLI